MSRASSLFLVSVLLTSGCIKASAQNAPSKWADTISREIDKADMSGELAKIQTARALAERVAMAYQNDGLILHYEAYALYREAILMTGKVGGNATPLLERAQSLLEKSLKSHPLAETHAIMSAIDGQLMAKNPSRAMELGIASNASMGAGLSMAPTNPRIWLLRGTGAIYTPPEYGGGLKAAEQQLKRAVEFFANDAPKAGEPSWGKAEAHMWLGQVYEKMGDKAKAAAEYKTAIEIAPGYMWARSAAAALK